MATTVRNVITDALREIGVLSASETATADDANSGLSTLNDLMDQWAAEELLIHTTTRTTWPIVSGIQDYTVGIGGTVNVARPVFIDHVQFVNTAADPDLEYQLSPLTDDAWSRIALKQQTSPMPTCWYYNPTFPLGALTLWPIPTFTTLLGALYAPEAVAEFASLDTVISLPPGYRRMIVKNLACCLAASYERDPRPDVKEDAVESNGGSEASEHPALGHEHRRRRARPGQPQALHLRHQQRLDALRGLHRRQLRVSGEDCRSGGYLELVQGSAPVTGGHR